MATVIEGDFEWDDRKARSNLDKHGVSFPEAATVFADPAAAYLDDGSGTNRMVVVGTSLRERLLKPPAEIDGAAVLYWAWSGEEPFFEMPVTGGEPIGLFGLAVCRYEDSGHVCRFSCGATWESENDSPFGSSVDAALSAKSGQYDVNQVAWQKWEP